ncbi:MAG: prepilin-type N-terminal cleavage/methylation domain-containing protein [Phycisphaerae bacterium]
MCLTHRARRGFTLIELLTVVAIISLLISILMPSLNRARRQAKAVHCLARLSDFAKAFSAYYNSYGALPPAEFFPDKDNFPQTRHGWAELLFAYVYGSKPAVTDQSFPLLFGLAADPQRYLLCRSARPKRNHSGHYRVYEPYPQPDRPARGWFTGSLEAIRPTLPLLGDSNPRSHAGPGAPNPDQVPSSYIAGGEAAEGDDQQGQRPGNRFDDRHAGAVNFLFTDGHAERSRSLRQELDRDWDLDPKTPNQQAP